MTPMHMSDFRTARDIRVSVCAMASATFSFSAKDSSFMLTLEPADLIQLRDMIERAMRHFEVLV